MEVEVEVEVDGEVDRGSSSSAKRARLEGPGLEARVGALEREVLRLQAALAHMERVVQRIVDANANAEVDVEGRVARAVDAALQGLCGGAGRGFQDQYIS